MVEADAKRIVTHLECLSCLERLDKYDILYFHFTDEDSRKLPKLLNL